MANGKMFFKEIRFQIDDEVTNVFVLVWSPDYSSINGWYTKTYPASFPCSDILNYHINSGVTVNWNKGAPLG